MKQILQKTLLMFSSIMLLSFLNANAISYTFTGPGNWSDATKWSPSYVGTNVVLHDVKILNTCTVDVNVTYDGSPMQVGDFFGAAGYITINSGITFTNNSIMQPYNGGTITNNGNFVNNQICENPITNNTGGTLTNNGTLRYEPITNNGIFNNNTGATFQNSYNFTAAAGSTTTNAGTWTNLVSSGTFSINFNGTFTNTGSFANNGAGVFNYNVGTTGVVNLNSGSFQNIYNWSNSGTINFIGGTYADQSSSQFVNNASGKINFANNYTIYGSITNNGIIHGAGTISSININGASTGSIQPGSILPAGVGIVRHGTLTFNGYFGSLGNQSLNFTITDASNYDKINSTNSYNISTNTINVTFDASYIPAINDEFTFMQFSSFNGAAPSVVNMPTLPAGMYWATSFAAGKFFAKILGAPYTQMTPISNTPVATFCLGTTYTVTISTTGGLAPFQYSANSGTTFQASPTFTLSTKFPSFRIKDALGNFIYSSPTFSTYPPINANATPSALCFGQASTSVTLTPNAASYSYTFNGGASQSSNVFNGVTAANNIPYTVTSNNGCIETGTVSVAQLPQIIYTASATSLSCGASPSATINLTAPSTSSIYQTKLGTGAYTNVQNTTGVGWYKYQNYTVTTAGTYTVTVKNTNGCTLTSVFNIQPALPNDLAQATTTNVNSTTGTTSTTQTQADLATINYVDANCLLICKLEDVTTGGALGSVTATVNVTGSNTTTFASNPYADRVYTITPTNQTGAIVTLYFTNDDILKYNLSSGALPPFASNVTASSIANNFSMPVNVTKVSGANVFSFNVAAVWKTISQRWEVTFPVSSFSTFQINTLPTAPLNVTFANFSIANTAMGNVLNWSTATEANNNYFMVERSSDGINYTSISNKILSKAANGNSNNTLEYIYTDNSYLPIINFYRITQVDLDGTKTTSSSLAINNTGKNNTIKIYPNPATNTLFVETACKPKSKLSINITDVSGKIIFADNVITSTNYYSTNFKIQSLIPGLYFIKIADANGVLETVKFTKQ